MFKDHSSNPLLSEQPEPQRNISLNRRLDDHSELDMKANFDQKGSIAINIQNQRTSLVRISTDSNKMQNRGIKLNNPNQKSSSLIRRDSQISENEYEKRMNIINMDEQSNLDNGFDPPTKVDSGRGISTTFGGSGYINRLGENMSLPQNHMFDIEEDNEDLFEQHQHDE